MARADNFESGLRFCAEPDVGLLNPDIVIIDITPIECGERQQVLKKLLRSVLFYRNYLNFRSQNSMVYHYGSSRKL